MCVTFVTTFAQQSEEILIYGDSKDTPNLPEAKYKKEAGCRENAGENCYLSTIIKVDVPAGWEFIGDPFVDITRENQGSAAWNVLDRKEANPRDKIEIITNTKLQKVARVWSSSWSIGIRLVCKAKKLPSKP